MYFRKIKIGNSFLLLIILYILGYTHLFGGPYFLAKFFFVLMLIGALVFSLFIWGMASFANKIFKKRMSNFGNKVEEKSETIKVDAKIVE